MKKTLLILIFLIFCLNNSYSNINISDKCDYSELKYISVYGISFYIDLKKIDEDYLWEDFSERFYQYYCQWLKTEENKEFFDIFSLKIKKSIKNLDTSIVDITLIDYKINLKLESFLKEEKNRVELKRLYTYIVDRLKNELLDEKTDKLKRTIINKLIEKINLNKTLELKNYSWDINKFNWNFYNSEYFKKEIKGGDIYYYLWWDSFFWKVALKLDNWVKFIVENNFYNGTFYFQNDLNKSAINKYSYLFDYQDSPFDTDKYIKVYPNGYILYHDILWDYLYIPDLNKVFDIDELMIKSWTDNFWYSRTYWISSFWENTITLEEYQNNLNFWKINRNGKEFITYDIFSWNIIDRKNVLQISDKTEDIKKSDYIEKEYNSSNSSLLTIFWDEYGYYLSLPDENKIYKKYRIINTGFINKNIDEKWIENIISEITFKLYDKKSKEIKWNYKNNSLYDWMLDFEEIPYIEVIDIK